MNPEVENKNEEFAISGFTKSQIERILLPYAIESINAGEARTAVNNLLNTFRYDQKNMDRLLSRLSEMANIDADLALMAISGLNTEDHRLWRQIEQIIEIAGEGNSYSRGILHHSLSDCTDIEEKCMLYWRHKPF